jgi:DNA polymerase IV
VRALGPAAGRHLAALAWGRDARSVTLLQRERSVGAQETFARDVDDPEIVLAELLRLSEKVGGRMRRAGLSGGTVTLTVRFADFSTVTRSRKLRGSTSVSREIFHGARDLYQGMHLDRARVRLVGVRMEGIVAEEDVETQLMLGEPDRGWREAEQAVDKVIARFGRGTVRHARLIPDKGPSDDHPGGARP